MALRTRALLLAALSAAVSSTTQRTQFFLWKFNYPSTPITLVYRFTIRVDEKAWDSIRLTEEERAALVSRKARPAGFIVEGWGRSFTRWRVFTLDAERPEQTFDF